MSRGRSKAGPLGLDRVSSVVIAACGLAAVGLLVFALVAEGSRAKTPPVGYGYWHTAGVQIVDSLNRPVRIAAVTWYGAETTTWVPGGLDYQPYRRIMSAVRRLGYNAIRISFSDELVQRNPRVYSWIAANPELRGLPALTVLDDIVDYAGKIGLKIILDDQRSAAAVASFAHPANVSTLDEEKWYTKKYPQSAWLADWKTLAARYAGNPTVIGFDLRNEPHTKAPSGQAWSLQTYLHDGATWGPYNGKDDPGSDWRLAAQRAGNAILSVNPKLLIIVEGLQLYPQADQPNGIDSYWWGGILKGVRQYPVVLNVPHQLVYSPHEYGPQKWPFYNWWRQLNYKNLSSELNQQWGFILNHPTAQYAAPLFLGETGTCTNHLWCVQAAGPKTLVQPCVQSQKKSSQCKLIRRRQGLWLHLLVRYIRSHPALGWSLWALNGSNALDRPTTDGLLNPNWSHVESPALQALLRTIQS